MDGYPRNFCTPLGVCKSSLGPALGLAVRAALPPKAWALALGHPPMGPLGVGPAARCPQHTGVCTLANAARGYAGGRKEGRFATRLFSDFGPQFPPSNLFCWASPFPKRGHKYCVLMVCRAFPQIQPNKQHSKQARFEHARGLQRCRMGGHLWRHGSEAVGGLCMCNLDRHTA